MIPKKTLLLLLALSFATTPAVAGDVFLNGVKVNGLRDQSFPGADVRFDTSGNIHITVTGVSVELQRDDSAAVRASKRVTPPVKSLYYLISSKTTPGLTQYDIQVHVNGEFVTKCRATDRQLAMEISRFLRPGRNQVVFTAFKDLSSPRKSFSPDQRFTLLLGKGMARGDQIVIERTLATYVRTAADISNDSVAITVSID
jgi:hypothetical protein